MSDASDITDCSSNDESKVMPSHTNRPGRSSLDYRIGTHSTFLKSMLACLVTQELPSGANIGGRSLSALTTRSIEDPTIAIIDAWAVVCDVLSFYQERIANENYLRTATERRSVLELARAIGYELNPGVAASTYLAFTVDDSDLSSGKAMIESGTQVQNIPKAQGKLPQTFETSEKFEARAEWNTIKPQQSEFVIPRYGSKEVYLKGVATGIEPGDPLLFIGKERRDDAESDRWDFRRVSTVTVDLTSGYTKVGWKEGLGWARFGRRIEPAEKDFSVYSFHERVALFGHNAPDWRATPLSIKEEFVNTGKVDDYDNWPGFDLNSDNTINLNAVFPKITLGSWVVLSVSDREKLPNYEEVYDVVGTEEESCADFTLTMKTTRLKLRGENLLEKFSKRRRDVTVFADSWKLELSETPLTTPVRGNSIKLDGQFGDLQKDQALIFSGKLKADDTDKVHEVVFVDSAIPSGETTTLILQDSGLKNSYVRSTVTICANVVKAMHGETITGEVLGNGDGTQTHQQFTLKRWPLTHVSASTASGAKSTLGLRVNNVLWQESPSLYGKTASEQNYILRINNDANAAIIFGDGKSGARLPTGQENITATYRIGIGKDGEVPVDSLTLLKTRPFGVRNVTNPLVGSGATDPEKLENARVNAPLTVLTLDRIVSLNDFENFTRAFAGIGKAQATDLWNGEKHLVHITVAGDSGGEIASTSATYRNLCAAINGARDPSVEVQLSSFEPLWFDLKATVFYNISYSPEDTGRDIKNALLAAFSFDQRTFGQPVTAAEVISIIHGVKGVVAVDMDILAVSSGNTVEANPQQTSSGVTLASVLPVKIARYIDGDTLLAQLLLINKDGIYITMKLAHDHKSISEETA